MNFVETRLIASLPYGTTIDNPPPHGAFRPYAAEVFCALNCRNPKCENRKKYYCFLVVRKNSIFAVSNIKK